MDIAIIGGGPAGLRAAEVATLRGAKVTLYEGKPSVGRKFLVAGKGGLNLTHSEALETFANRYQGSYPEGFWVSLLSDFDHHAMCDWAAGLGVETFVGTSGRIFPRALKAAPLLRRWVERLRSLGVRLEMRHRLLDLHPHGDRFTLTFLTHAGEVTISHDIVILALGGASWPETGSDGGWVSLLQNLGIAVAPLTPANCGWEVNWHPDILAESEGLPLKNLLVSAGERKISGELLITSYGLEGGALYQLGSALRGQENPSLTLDLKPSFSAENLARKILPSSENLLTSAISAWRLGRAAASLLKYLSSEKIHRTPLTLAKFAKNLPLPLIGPRPITEAISSAGGVAFSELDEDLMVKRFPGLFVAGEMIDWEAPTGGYLLQGCFATATRAAKGSSKG